MRKTTFLIVFFIPFLMLAQQQSMVIKVTGQAIHTDASPMFKANVSLSSDYSSLPSEMTTLSLLKDKYKEALKAKGIAWSNLKENLDNFGYESLGYSKEGVLYEYKTKSFEEMKSFLEVESLGMRRLNYVSVIEIDREEMEKLSKTALANAKVRALAIAKAMGKDLGDIQEVEDFNNRFGEKIENPIYYDRPYAEYRYMLNVVFTVK